ncbi:MAG: CoA transferase [Dehalococcoidia bacterium]
MNFPLASVRVLDLADEPVALAPRLLADLGADVVRVEPPTGDWLRMRGPFVHGERGLERGLAHLNYNAGKRSVALDLETKNGIVRLKQLLGKASVVIAPLEPADHLAPLLEEEEFSRCSSAGLVVPVFRRGAPDRATDLTGIAAGGQLFLNGDSEDPPNHPAGNLAYKQLALASALAAMSLILEASDGRKPGRIEVSMQEAVMWTTIQSANENYAFWDRPTPARRGLGNLAGQSVFRTSDDLFVSFSQHPPAWPAFARWYEERFADSQYTAPQWEDGLYRVQNNQAIVEATERLCASMGREELVTDAQERGILCVPVHDVSGIATDQHLRERGFFSNVELPQLGEELELIRPPFISSNYRSAARAAPALGEQTDEVFREWCGIDISSMQAVRP